MQKVLKMGYLNTPVLLFVEIQALWFVYFLALNNVCSAGVGRPSGVSAPIW